MAWLLAREKQTPRSLLASRVLPLRRIERARYLKKTDRRQNECTSDAVLRTNKHWLAWHGRQRESAARKHCLLCLLFCASTVPVWTWLLCRAHVSSQCAVCFFERGLPRACHNTQAFARYKGQKTRNRTALLLESVTGEKCTQKTHSDTAAAATWDGERWLHLEQSRSHFVAVDV